MPGSGFSARGPAEEYRDRHLVVCGLSQYTGSGPELSAVILTDWAFPLRRPLLFAYALFALGLSATLLLFGLRRGPGEFSLWVMAYLALGLLAWRRPQIAPIAAGMMALLLGFVRTYRGGFNVDLGLGLIVLSVGLWVLGRARRAERATPLDLAGVSLLLIAVWALLSLGFSVARIRAFTPAPGFAFRWYAFNPFELSSEEAIIRATVGASILFAWFGLYEYARSAELRRGPLNVAVFVALLANATVLLIQGHVDPDFLHPIGFPQTGRLNGLTSFCYALGDALLSLFLLLPAWGVWRGWRLWLTAGSLGLVAHGVVVSGSRTALFAMLLATALWACLGALRLWRERQPLRAAAVMAAVASLPFLVMAAYQITPPDDATPLGRLKWGVEREGLLTHVFSGRLSSYPLIFRVIGEYPLSGVGAGLYPAEVSKQHRLLMPELDIEDPFLLTSFAPNQFLNTGAELGLLALLALVLVFVSAFANVARFPREKSAFGASLLLLAVALLFGPSFNNSEALVFFWLVIGQTAATAGVAGRGDRGPVGRPVAVQVTSALVAGAVVVGVAGQLLARPSLAVDRQWERLRWRLAMGMLAPEDGGRWTGPEATFVVDTPARSLSVRWHAGDEAAQLYQAVVSFYVDGELVEETIGLPGRIRESVLPLPEVAGFKRISVRASPPFVPAEAIGGEDRRQLGVFIHASSPADEAPPEGSLPREPADSLS